jgi:hypothetical protein
MAFHQKGYEDMKKLFALLIIVPFLLSGCVLDLFKPSSQKISYGDSELRYTEDITESLAQKAGDWLDGYGYWEGSAKTVELAKPDNTYQVRIVLADEASADDADVVSISGDIANMISSDVFDGAATEVHLCNTSLKTLKVVQQTEQSSDGELAEMEFNDSVLYYSPSIPNSLVKDFGNYLISEAEMMVEGDQMELKLEQDGDAYIFSFVATEDALNSEDYQQTCIEFTRQLSSDVFDSAIVKIHLCDDNWDPVYELTAY